MGHALSRATLVAENRTFAGTGGVSAECRGLGFAPGFLDKRTGAVYRSAFANGLPAPIHVLDGLPADLIAERSACGRACRLIEEVISGFIRDGRFYTRDQVAALA